MSHARYLSHILIIFLQNLHTDMDFRETQLREELQSTEAEIIWLKEELRKCQGLPQDSEDDSEESYDLKVSVCHTRSEYTILDGRAPLQWQVCHTSRLIWGMAGSTSTILSLS